jgi:hypothetical protein
MAALAGRSPVSVALIFVLLAIAGHVAFCGADRRPRRIRVADAEGIDRAEVEELLIQASRRLRGLEIAAESIAVPAVRRRLTAVLSTGNAILRELERRPSEASRVRRFLNVYLDGAERVTSEYARTAASPGRSAPDREYQALLEDLERAFTAQHRRLVGRHPGARDVDQQVLTAPVRPEVPADGENRP